MYKTCFSGNALWPNLIFQRFRSKNRLTGLKFTPILENSRLCTKIVQNVLFRQCAGRFGQIAFLSGKFSKSSHWPEILSKTGKQCAFHENCTKRSFQVMRSTFWPNRIFERLSFQNRETGLKFSSKRKNSAVCKKIVQNPTFQVIRSTFCPNLIFERQSSENRETGLKFSSKRKNSALFMKIVQNALFRSCAARFGQIAFLSVKVFKIVKLALNSFQSGKRVRFSGHAHFFKTEKQCAFLSVKVLKIVTLA